MMNDNNEIDWQQIQCFKKEVKAECQLTSVTYFSASRCISSRFCLRNSLRRSKSKSSSMMIHTAFWVQTERKSDIVGFIKIWTVLISLIQSQDVLCQLFGL